MSQIEKSFIRLLQAALAGRSADSGELAADVPVDEVLRLAAKHKLSHMILSAIPLELLPESADRRTALLGQVTAQVSLSDTFLKLWGDIQDAGFHPLVVKGIVCRSLYSQPELRPSCDEDLYVSSDEFEACCDFLQKRGMTPDKTPFIDYGEVGWRDESGLFIELHRDLFEGDEMREMREFFTFDNLERESYATPYGTCVTSLKPHDHFLYLLLHAYKHFIHSGFGIRQVCDIGMWARRYGDGIDWRRICEQCDAVRIRQFASAVLGIARYDLLIDFSVPAELEVEHDYCRPMLADILSAGIYGSADTDRQHSATMTLNAVKAERTNTRFSVLQSIFPPRAAMAEKYLYVKKHPILLPAAWIHRIADYAKRNRSGETNASASLAIGKERIELMRYYGIVD
jgi:hypothetical protein